MMNTLHSWIESKCNRNPLTVLIILFFLFSWMLAIRSLLITYPVCLPDELIYIFLAKFLGQSNILKQNFFVSSMPNSLFFHIYHLVFGFGENSLMGARVLNTMLFSSCIFLLYGISRFFLSPGKSVLISAFCLFIPVNSYVSYFMPEILYFAFFYVLLFLILFLIPYKFRMMLITAALVISLMSLVKPQGNILVLPSTIVFAYIALKNETKNKLTAIYEILIYFLIPIFAMRFLLLLIFSSGSYFSVGSIYDYLINITFNFLSIKNLYFIMTIMSGHIFYLLVIWFIPILLLCLMLTDTETTSPNYAYAIRTRCFAYLLIAYFATLIITTSLFTAAVTGLGPHETASRLHGRYYSFLFPLLVIGMFVAMQNLDFGSKKAKYAFKYFLCPIMLVVLLAGTHLLGRYSSGLTDYPEIFWLSTAPPPIPLLFLVLSGCAFISFVFWKTKRLFIYTIFLLLIFTFSSCYSLKEQIQISRASRYDRAGLMVKNLVSNGKLNSGYIIRNPEDVGIFRVLFQLGTPVKYADIPSGSEINADMIPDSSSWLLVLGSYNIRFPHAPGISGDGYELIRLDQ